MFSCNIISLVKNFDYLEDHILKQDFDIVALIECWIAKYCHIPFLKGYKNEFIPSICGKSGGIVVYIRNNLCFEKIEHKCINPEAQLEFLTIKMLKYPYIINVAYRHPKGQIDSFLKSIEDIICKKDLTLSDKSILFCGDYNLNILDDSNKNVQLYKSLLSAYGYLLFIHQPTRVSKTSATCIDHVFGRNMPSSSIQTKVEDILISDHKAILIFASDAYDGNVREYTQFRNHCKSNITKFRNNLQNIDWNNHVKANQDLDNNMETFISIISSIYLESFSNVKMLNG